MKNILDIEGRPIDPREAIYLVEEIDGLIDNVDNAAVVPLAGQRSDRLSVSLAPDQPVELLQPVLGRLDLVVLHFPTFADGRAFSQARLLRTRFGFTGDLRASGDLVQDQLAFMLSCGFNQFEVAADVEPLQLAAARDEARQFANLLARTTPVYPDLDRQVVS